MPRSRPALGERAAEAERGLALFFIGVRATPVVPMMIGVVSGAGQARSPVVYTIYSIAVAAFVVVLGLAVWRARTPRTGWWGPTDLVVTLSTLPALALLLPPDIQVGNWTTWSVGFATSATAGLGAWARSFRSAFAASLLIGVTYVAAMLVLTDAALPWIVGNGTVLALICIPSWVFCSHLRSLAARADASQQEALRVTKQAELDRYRLMVHDASGILRLLGDEGTPPAMLPALRSQATTESARLRTYLSDAARAAGSSTGAGPGAPESDTLAGVARSAVAGFLDLPLDLAVDLAEDTTLSEGDALAVHRALVTVLHNVRRHAAADQVVVHADGGPDGWEVSVRDDGVGFDSAGTTLGFGLREQVVGELERRGLAVTVRSHPGAGTTVVIAGD